MKNVRAASRPSSPFPPRKPTSQVRSAAPDDDDDSPPWEARSRSSSKAALSTSNRAKDLTDRAKLAELNDKRRKEGKRPLTALPDASGRSRDAEAVPVKRSASWTISPDGDSRTSSRISDVETNRTLSKVAYAAESVTRIQPPPKSAKESSLSKEEYERLQKVKREAREKVKGASWSTADEEDEDIGEEEPPKPKNLPSLGSVPPNRRKLPPKTDVATAKNTPVESVARSEHLPSALDDEMRSGLNSLFGDKAGRVIELLEFNETDGATTLLYTTILQTLVSVLPMAESAVRNSGGSRGLYQLSQLISGIREMLADLQNRRDQTQAGLQLVERVLRPAYQELAAQMVIAMTNLTSTFQSFNSSTEDLRDFRAAVEQQKQQLSAFMMRQYMDSREAVIATLG